MGTDLSLLLPQITSPNLKTYLFLRSSKSRVIVIMYVVIVFKTDYEYKEEEVEDELKEVSVIQYSEENIYKNALVYSF